MNKFAITITKKEKGKKEVNIAQTKEIIKLVFQELAKININDVIKTIDRYRKRRKR